MYGVSSTLFVIHDILHRCRVRIYEISTSAPSRNDASSRSSVGDACSHEPPINQSRPSRNQPTVNGQRSNSRMRTVGLDSTSYSVVESCEGSRRQRVILIPCGSVIAAYLVPPAPARGR